ncbi:hypothetical protein NY2A_b493L [Paramecium bursaria Chlorella virus NY2A]|uniref:Uncharacterized protein b493L n=1 Tax=Paramecium bursaria Chlorella virus NY2A TaxID=46021 RepID=A7IX18_PBCVN|nr:hypothetical protein NY2A_b493L [Paramecium bursaria Chlorella virus NY2A]ABT14892.1 hypothetical protein NY2A_b493L [Paramecium bursaria Chlorella virus NY2A]
MFHEVPDIVSKSGLTYEISDPDWIVVSVSTKGNRKILKSDDSDRVNLAGERYTLYELAKFADLDQKSWPDDERELDATSE